jgi:cystathionine beta-synthase
MTQRVPEPVSEEVRGSAAEVFETVIEAIGRTPLIRLNRVTEGLRTPVYAKMESFNPGGSVKDRIGLALIESAERAGLLGPDGTVVEGTSGNTGVGLAIVAAVRGYRCIFTIPDKMSDEKIKLLRALGAEVIVTPSDVPPDHPDYYVNAARRIAEETPGAFMADQHYNPDNPEAHYRTTGPEIWHQTEGRVTHFVASPGTGGTISGTGRYLKERNPEIRIVAGDPEGSIYAEYARTGEKGPDAPYLVEGVGNDKISATVQFEWIDEFRTVSDHDAFAMARRLAREEGLLSGGSTGLIVTAALEVAREVDDPDACVVTLLCDSGERYLSKVFDEEWLKANGLESVLKSERQESG